MGVSVSVTCHTHYYMQDTVHSVCALLNTGNAIRRLTLLTGKPSLKKKYKCKSKDYFTQNTQKKYVFEIVAIKIIEAKTISNFQKKYLLFIFMNFVKGKVFQG